MGIMALSWMTYYILGEWLFGGTLGKHMMGIQVRSGTEAPATISQIIVRNVARFVDVIGLYLLGFAVAACSKRNQRSGDHLAGTVVFEAKTDRGFALFLWICWLLVISIGTVLVQRAATS